jgi:hypothetical protein
VTGAGGRCFGRPVEGEHRLALAPGQAFARRHATASPSALEVRLGVDHGEIAMDRRTAPGKNLKRCGGRAPPYCRPVTLEIRLSPRPRLSQICRFPARIFPVASAVGELQPSNPYRKRTVPARLVPCCYA